MVRRLALVALAALAALAALVGCGSGAGAPVDGAVGGDAGVIDAPGSDAMAGDAAVLSFGLTDELSHPPPADGPHPYSPPGDWLPGQAGFPALGDSYVDPVFGAPVTRITDVHPNASASQIYVRNGFWNADGSLFMHHLPGCDSELVDTATGAAVRTGVPGCWRASFDPVDPDVLYYPQGSELRSYRVSAGTSSVVKDFGATLGSLGGSVDYIDRTGRYFVLDVGGSVRVWDKLTDTIYAGALGAQMVGTGWIAMSPNAAYLVVPGDFAFTSYAIDHDSKTLDTGGVLFWTLCGDHADVISPSDGKTYLVGFECWDEAAIYRIDVSLPQSGDTAAARQKQRDDNLMLLDLDWSDSGHISCVSGAGPYRDVCYHSVTSGDDSFADPGMWRPYKQEIVMMQVTPPYPVRRLAHHRSRSTGDSYQYQPRASTSWDGRRVGWVSNYGDSGSDYADVYVIHLP
jgi:hypothetical protein